MEDDGMDEDSSDDDSSDEREKRIRFSIGKASGLGRRITH